MRKLKVKQRMFQGIPVKEGRGDILVQPTKSDIKGAIPHDPENCAYALCLRRMLNTSRVFVYTTVAYVETLDEQGHPTMERYMVKNHAHAWVQKFDRGEEVSPGGFILHKPERSKTLEYKRAISNSWARDHRERTKEYAKRGWLKQKARKKALANGKEFSGTFRNGTGQVRFIGTADGMLTAHRE